MAKLPGLVPVNEDRISGPRRTRASRRVAPEIVEARPLRPTAAPVNTYVRPPEAPRSNDLLDVAAALQSFSPVLTQAFENMEAKQAASAEAAVAQSTVEELQAHVRAGTSPISSSPIAAKAFAKSAAQQLAVRRLSEAQAAWDGGDFDRDNGDFDAFLAEAARGDLEGIADEDAKNAYGGVFNKFSPRLRAQATEYKVKREKDTALTAVGDTWFAAVSAGITEGKSPAELQAALRGQYGQYKDTMGLQPQELDAVVLGVARRLAENPNNEAYVEHFLNDTRGGVGSIAAKQDTGPAAQVIINRAQASTAAYQKEQLRLQNKAAADRDAALLESRVEVAAENGTLSLMVPADVRTESGDTKTITADDQQKQGIELIRKKAEAMAAEGKPDEGMNFRLGSLMKNGLVDPQFKSVLKAGPASANREALEKGQIPPALRAGVDLYETLYTRSPRLLAQHVSAEDQFFYEAFRVARQDLQYDEAGAFEAAVKFTDKANPQELPASLRQDIYSLKDKLGQLRSGSSWWNPFSWGDGKSITMTDDAARKMEQWGEFYVRLGKSPDEALDLATKRIRDSHTIINGNPVPTTDRNLPPNFEGIAEWKLGQWAEKYGAKYGLDAEDLTITPSGDGQQGVWMITRRDGNGPVMVMEDDARAALNFSARTAKGEFEEAERAGIIKKRNNKTEDFGEGRLDWYRR
ncbi:hypothetical protein EJV44_15530 [Ancylobacter aquaticus]|nr:hypothetical protein EJV44_15530 [Ancylobacter aquaticus]